MDSLATLLRPEAERLAREMLTSMYATMPRFEVEMPHFADAHLALLLDLRRPESRDALVRWASDREYRHGLDHDRWPMWEDEHHRGRIAAKWSALRDDPEALTLAATSFQNGNTSETPRWTPTPQGATMATKRYDAKHDYYSEALANSAEEHGATLTHEQVDAIAEDIARAADLWPEASGELEMTRPGKRPDGPIRSKADIETIARLELCLRHLKEEAGRVANIDPSRIGFDHDGSVLVYR